MFPSVATLRLSAGLFLILNTAAMAGPADDLKAAALQALGALPVSGAAFGDARDEGGAQVLTNITFASTGDRPLGVKIARATITGGTGDALSGARIKLEDLEGTTPDGQAYRLPSAELNGVRGSLAAVLASFASREPFLSGASEQAATKFSADTIAAPTLTIVRRHQGTAEETTYTAVAVSGYAQGKMAELTIASAVLNPDKGNRKVEFGTMRFVGYDLTAGVRTGGNTAEVLESASLSQLRGTNPGGRPFTIERIAIGKVAMRPGERSLVALSQDLTGFEAATSGTDEPARRRAFGALVEVLSRLDFNLVEMTNLRGTDDGGRGFEMQRFAIAGITQGKIGSIEMAGIAAEQPNQQKTSIGRFVIEGIDATGLLALGKDFAEGRYNPSATPPLTAYPDVRRLLAENIAVVTAGRPAGSLQKLEVDAGPRVGLVPTRLRLRATGFEAPVTDARQRAQLAPIGIEDKITLSAEIDIEYAEAARELRLQRFNIDAEDIGTLTGNLTIGGIDRAAVEGLPGTAALLGLSAKAGPLTLTYKENGAVGAFLSHTAEQAGVEEDALTEQIKAQIAASVAQFVTDKLLVAQISSAANTFLDDPKSLTVTATPKSDTPLAALAVAARGSPLAVLSLFTITVDANK